MADECRPDDAALLGAEALLRRTDLSRSDRVANRGFHKALSIMAETPAETAAGARVKAAALLDEIISGESDYGRQIARGLVADLGRIAQLAGDGQNA
jgi:hypothetical protein